MLIDTHVLLWLLSDDRRLGPAARAHIDRGPEVFVSAASLWEIAIKVGLGKVAAPDDLPTRISAAGLSLLPVTGGHAWGTRVPCGLPHRDPFDRMLVQQAISERLPFVTADAAILTSELDPALVLVDARA